MTQRNFNNNCIHSERSFNFPQSTYTYVHVRVHTVVCGNAEIMDPRYLTNYEKLRNGQVEVISKMQFAVARRQLAFLAGNLVNNSLRRARPAMINAVDSLSRLVGGGGCIRAGSILVTLRFFFLSPFPSPTSFLVLRRRGKETRIKRTHGMSRDWRSSNFY